MACWARRVSRATLASRRCAYHDELRMFSRSNRARNSGLVRSQPSREVPSIMISSRARSGGTAHSMEPSAR